MTATLLVVPLVLAWACEASLFGPLEEGVWGGTGIALHVSATSVTVELDCASGTLATRPNFADGRFDVAGEFVRGHGGPAREGELPDAHDARYIGQAHGNTLELSVRLDDGQEYGPWDLRRDRPPVLHLCL